MRGFPVHSQIWYKKHNLSAFSSCQFEPASLNQFGLKGIGNNQLTFPEIAREYLQKQKELFLIFFWPVLLWVQPVFSHLNTRLILELITRYIKEIQTHGNYWC